MRVSYVKQKEHRIEGEVYEHQDCDDRSFRLEALCKRGGVRLQLLCALLSDDRHAGRPSETLQCFDVDTKYGKVDRISSSGARVRQKDRCLRVSPSRTSPMPMAAL